ncbi:MAG: hypothetical protein JNJ57_13405 [Saprospiraceae bacterium]|nr:hypothetical protein [Saprospiraceae bacterium]
MKKAILFFTGLVLALTTSMLLDYKFSIEWMQTLFFVFIISLAIGIVEMYRIGKPGLFFMTIMLSPLSIPVSAVFHEAISEFFGLAAFDCRGEYHSGPDAITVAGEGKNNVTISFGNQIYHARVVGETLLLDGGDTLHYEKTSYANPDTTELENIIRVTRIFGNLKGQQVEWVQQYKMYESETWDVPVMPCCDF